MAAWLNKWFLLFLLPSGIYTASERPLLQPAAPGQQNTGPAMHPFHVSVVGINHNAAEKTLEISCKLFTDDFEKVLAQNYKTKVDLINAPDKKAMDTLVKKYIMAHLAVMADGKPVQFSYLGFEREMEAVYGYLQVSSVPAVKKIEITDKLLHDLFTDQVNLVHVTVGGSRKSVKLDYPAATAVLTF